MNQETKVGFFILLALAVILPSILFIGNIRLFQKSRTFYVEFSDVQALPPKAAVKIAGVEIGKVAKIKLHEGKARVKINIDSEIILYRNAAASIGSTGIIGTRFIELKPGTPDAPPLEPGALILGDGASSLEDMISKVTSFFDEDPSNGNAVDNLKITLANIRRVSDSLNYAMGKKEKEMEEIVLNIRDLTRNAKKFTADLKNIISERKDDVKVALLKFREVSEKLDKILTKIDSGEGTIGALVSDEKTAQDVKDAISSIKTTAESAEGVLGRFTKIDTHWQFRWRYDFRDEEGKADAGIAFIPRPGKFYAFSVSNIGKAISNEKTMAFERKNRITAVMGHEWHMFTGYAGAIRSDGGVGLIVRPFWFNKTWERRVSLDVEAADFSRDRTVLGRRLDSTWVAAGGKLALQRWLWIGARWEDILERSAFMANVNIEFNDEDLSYFLGFAAVAN